MKKIYLLAVISVLGFGIGTYSFANYVKGENNIPETKRTSDGWLERKPLDAVEDVDILDDMCEESFENKEEDETVVSEDMDTLAISSRDGLYNVFVRTNNSRMLHIYNNKTNELDDVEMGLYLSTGIMSLEWLDDTKVAVFSHVNPSVGCLDIYDVVKKEVLFEEYCSEYSWTDGIESLVYVEPAPHLGRQIGNESLLNYEGEILYESGNTEKISEVAKNEEGDLAIILDNMTDRKEVQDTKLLILKSEENMEDSYEITEEKKVNGDEVENLTWENESTLSFYEDGQLERLEVQE